MTKLYLSIAALSGVLAVMLGAFGAHGLRDKLTPALMSAYQTGVQYQFYHTLALLAVAMLLQRLPQSLWLQASGGLFVIGMLMFSGSLYGLALGGPSWLGPVTPIGGLCFMLAWLGLLVAALRMS
jgi:uncharacterized membrane protein YgdD (TMEM256/DUF423 family)